MSVQLTLCARMLNAGCVAEVLAYGITQDDFTDQDTRAVFRSIWAYFMDPATHGSIISRERLNSWVPGVIVPPDIAMETTDALCYQVRCARLRLDAQQLMVHASDLINNPTIDPQTSILRIQTEAARLTSLGSHKNTDSNSIHGYKAIMRRMGMAESSQVRAVMQWPWYPLQRVTFGLQPDDYVIYYGRPKSKKTWVLAETIATAVLNEIPCCIYTKEMTTDNLWQRVIACIHKIPYEAFRASMASAAMGGAPLDPVYMERITRYFEQLENDPLTANNVQILNGNDVRGQDTVGWLEAKCKRHGAKILFIDGLYLLTDQGKHASDHQRVLNISRDTRNMILHTGIPVVATLQANRKASQHREANLDEIAYSDALSQDCTLAARIIKDKAQETACFVIGGSREYSLHGFRFKAECANDFSYLHELSEKDTEKLKTADEPDEEPSTKQEPKRAKTANKEVSKETNGVYHGRTDKEGDQRIAENLYTVKPGHE
jgi:replicative DNA helicase